MAELNDLKTTLMKLIDESCMKDLHVVRTCLYDILTLSTNGCNVTPALPTVVKLLAHSDAFVKRVASEIIAIHTEQSPDMVLLATNTLVQNCKDVNPVVRGLAIRGLGSFQSKTVAEFLAAAVTDGLEDSSPYVRKSSALAAMALYRMCPTSVTEGEIWDLLYRHLRDEDPVTVANCLCALEEIFADEKGTIVSNKLGHYLIRNIFSYTPTVQRVVLQFLLKFSPKTKEKIFENLNDIDSTLTKSNILALTLCSLELFCHLTSGLQKVRTRAYLVAWTTVKNNLARERSEEIVTAVTEYLSTTEFPVSVCGHEFQKFLCRDDDSQYLMNQKICMLSKLIGPENVEIILQEFLSCARYMSLEAVREMIQNIASTIKSKPEVEKDCTEFFLKLMQLDNVAIFECIVQVLPSVSFSDNSHQSLIAVSVLQNFHMINSQSGRIAVSEIIRSHGSEVDKAPEILSKILNELDEGEGNSVCQIGRTNDDHLLHQYDQGQLQLKLSLLGATARVCLMMPAQTQALLARLMEMCVNDVDPSVRDRALFLYGYLFSKVREKIGNDLSKEVD